MDSVKALYEAEYRPLLVEYAESTIAELAQEISGAIESEYLRWPELRDEKEWEDAVAGIIDFLEKRLTLLDALWLEDAVYYEITVAASDSNLYVAEGMPPEDLPRNGSDPEGLWYLEGTDTPFDVTRPVTGNVRLSPYPASETPPETEPAEEDAEQKAAGFSTQDYITAASVFALVSLLLGFICVDFFLRRKDRRNADAPSRTEV